MKIYKRAAALLAGAMIVAGAVPTCASEVSKTMTDTKEVVRVARASSKTTTPPDVYISTKEIDDDMYLLIRASADDGIDWVKVDGNKVYDKYDSRWKYKITKSATYNIEVCGNNGKITSKSYEAKYSSKPTVSLSKSTSGSTTYLVIKANDEGSIKKITVNDDKLSDFKSNGETKVKITKSGKYTVEVTDNDGNTAEESLTINLDNDAPTVKLSKKKVSNKWYLVMKITPNDGNKIDTVKVNGKKVTCNRAGEEIQYEASSTGTYKVVVTDNAGLETTESLYINVTEGGEAPKLTLTTVPGNGVSYISITVSDEDKVDKLTVNGVGVTISSGGGTVRYPVNVAGNYTVIATDNDGNQTSQSIYVTVGSVINNPTNTGSSHTVVFKLNQKSWKLDGVSQAMDAAPIAKNNRTYIPLRYVSNALGISASNITWDKNSKTVIIKDGSNVIKVPLGKKTMTLNGQTIAMDSPAIQSGGRVMVPISQVSKAFTSRNVKLDWNKNTKEVVITRK